MLACALHKADSGMSRATPGAAGIPWQPEQSLQEPLLAIRPLNVSTGAPPVYTAPINCAAPVPVLLGWQGADQAAAAQLPGQALRLRAAPSPIMIDQQRRHQRQLSEAFEKYVVQSDAARYVYGNRQAPAGSPAQLPAGQPPTPVAFWGAQSSPAQMLAKLAPAPAAGHAGQSTLVRPQPIRPAAPQLTGHRLAPFEYRSVALFQNVRRPEGASAAGEAFDSRRAAALPAGAALRGDAGVQELQGAATITDAAPLLCTESDVLRSASGGGSGSAEVQESGAEKHASPPAAGPAIIGSATAASVPELGVPLATEAWEQQRRQEQSLAAAAVHEEAPSQGHQSFQAEALSDTFARSCAAPHVLLLQAEAADAAAGSHSREDKQEVVPKGSAEEEAQPPQSPDSRSGAPEPVQPVLEAAEMDLNGPEVHRSQPHPGLPADWQCSEQKGQGQGPAAAEASTESGVSVPVELQPAEQLAGRECSEPHENEATADAASAGSGVLVPVELWEDDIAAARPLLEKNIAVAAALGSPRRVVCTEAPPLAAGRMKRVPGGDPLAVRPPSALVLELVCLYLSRTRYLAFLSTHLVST